MQNRRNHLNPFDVFVLTLIFFGHAIYSSTAGYLELLAAGRAVPERLDMDASSSWMGIGTELASLALAAVYLLLRRFDFRQLDFGTDRRTPAKVAAYILAAGLVAAVCEYALSVCFPQLYADAAYPAEDGMAWNAHWSLPYFLFAFLNGFYEELFFVGLLFAVRKKHLPYVLLAGLLVRFAFHTYQGMAGALTITTLGVVFMLLRLKYRDLLPFMLAHSFFDLFGLTWMLYLLAD